jgi:hypothetical protein
MHKEKVPNFLRVYVLTADRVPLECVSARVCVFIYAGSAHSTINLPHTIQNKCTHACT